MRAGWPGWAIAFFWFAVQIPFIGEPRKMPDLRRWEKYTERLSASESRHDEYSHHAAGLEHDAEDPAVNRGAIDPPGPWRPLPSRAFRCSTFGFDAAAHRGAGSSGLFVIAGPDAQLLQSRRQGGAIDAEEFGGAARPYRRNSAFVSARRTLARSSRATGAQGRSPTSRSSPWSGAE